MKFNGIIIKREFAVLFLCFVEMNEHCPSFTEAILP